MMSNKSRERRMRHEQRMTEVMRERERLWVAKKGGIIRVLEDDFRAVTQLHYGLRGDTNWKTTWHELWRGYNDDDLIHHVRSIPRINITNIVNGVVAPIIKRIDPPDDMELLIETKQTLTHRIINLVGPSDADPSFEFVPKGINLYPPYSDLTRDILWYWKNPAAELRAEWGCAFSHYFGGDDIISVYNAKPQDIDIDPCLFSPSVDFDADVFTGLWRFGTWETGSDNQPSIYMPVHSALCVATALAFLNCRNVEMVDVAPDPEASRVYERHFGEPLTGYKVIRIKSMGKSYGGSSDKPYQGIMPLHIRRGNFATYTEDAPLFGKYTGTFWRPATAVGEKDNGIVVSDYEVGDDD